MNPDFIKYQAQTSPYPLGMEVSHAIGSYIYDTNDKKYLDFVAGVSACTLGHQHPRVNQAIKDQLDKYSHVMVYGEYSQSPAVQYCKMMASLLPESLILLFYVRRLDNVWDIAWKGDSIFGRRGSLTRLPCFVDNIF